MAVIRWIADKLGARDAGWIANREAVVYSRSGCHLCDEAVESLERNGLHPTLIDIDSDPRLAALYTNCVPVVVIDGRELFRGRVNEILLRRILRRDSLRR